MRARWSGNEAHQRRRGGGRWKVTGSLERRWQTVKWNNVLGTKDDDYDDDDSLVLQVAHVSTAYINLLKTSEHMELIHCCISEK